MVLTPKELKARIKSFRAYGADGSTIKEIADRYGVSKNTIHTWMNEYQELRVALRAGKSTMKTSIRGAQLRAGVEEGNTAMLIHLGKVYLKQLREEEKKEGGGKHQITLNFVDGGSDGGSDEESKDNP